MRWISSFNGRCRSWRSPKLWLPALLLCALLCGALWPASLLAAPNLQASATPTRTRTRTPTGPTATRTPTGPSATPTRTRTPTGPTATRTRTRTPTGPSATPTRTRTPTGPTPTFTRTNTRTSTVTRTPTNSATPTNTATSTATPTASNTATATPTPTSTATPTPAGPCDSYEPNNSSSQAGALLPGTTQLHRLCQPGDQDWSVFVATRGQTYWIETLNLAPGVDTLVELYRPDGTTLIRSRDDIGETRDSLIVHTAQESGPHYLRVRHFDSAQGGLALSYELRLRVDAACPDAAEPNDSRAQAALVTPGQQLSGLRFCAGDREDWYRFTATANTTYHIDALNQPRGLETFLTLYQGSSTSPHTAIGSANTGMLVSLSQAGTYYLKLTSRQPVPDPLLRYDLRIAVRPPCNDLHEPNDGQSQARQILPGETQRHVFCRPLNGLDGDWIFFQAEPGQIYTVETLNLAPGLDTALTLYDSAGNWLRFDNDGGAELGASYMVLSTTTTATYYLQVGQIWPSEQNSAAAVYDIVLRATAGARYSPSEPNDSQAQASPLTLGLAQHNSFCSAGDSDGDGQIDDDQDWFSFAAVAGTRYRIETRSAGSSYRPVLALYNQQGQRLLGPVDGFPYPNFQPIIEFVPAQSGIYSVQSIGYGGYCSFAQSGYDLRVLAHSDTAEPNDRYQQASTFPLNQLQRQQLLTTRDVDWFWFDAQAGVTYQLELLNFSRKFQSRMRLYSAGDLNNPLVTRLGDLLANLLRYTPGQSGRYYLRVDSSSASDAPAFGYDLCISDRGACGEKAAKYEPNNTQLQARPIVVGSTQTHAYSHQGDIDWLSFQAVAGTTYRIKTSHYGRPATMDMRAEVYAGDGTLLGGAGSLSGVAELVVTTPLSGPYFIKVLNQQSTDGFSQGRFWDIALSSFELSAVPATDPTLPGDIARDTAFLYSGPSPIQLLPDPAVIDPLRMAVLRGKVTGRDGAPLGGVKVSAQQHPEYGYTYTRADGMFDLAVNGGPLTINYEQPGRLPAQRQIAAPWRDFAWLPDVVLIPLDSAVTTISLGGANPPQVARANPVGDADGTRRATMFFPAGVTAEMLLPNGSRQPLTTLNVRATEYTVGPNGPAAMPGPLPPSSGYTYALEYTVDEALAANATEVRFSQPVIHYVENFIGFPVGGDVPVGFYDRQKAAWLPAPDGRVIEIVGVAGGMALLDITGDGLADDASALGVSEAERQQLATLYSVGQELWRVPLAHFTPWDCNWPYGPPPGAVGPVMPPWLGQFIDTSCIRAGSKIECQNQALGEAVPVEGAPFRLHYQSDRVPGRSAANEIHIPLRDQRPFPPGAKHIDLELAVAGQRLTQQFALNSALTTTVRWDGKDAYGRQLHSPQPASVRLGYAYEGVYWDADESQRSFASFGTRPISGNRDALELTLWQDSHLSLGISDLSQAGLGGWSLSAQHRYDPDNRLLSLGDGRHVHDQAGLRPGAITLAAGGGEQLSDGSPARLFDLGSPMGLALGPQGSIYIADADYSRAMVYELRRDGSLHVVAGNLRWCPDGFPPGYNGDGILATSAILNQPRDVAVGADGSVYIADTFNNRIRRVDPVTKLITTVAGGAGGPLALGDGGPATSAYLDTPSAMTVGADGSLYIAELAGRRIRRVGPDGIISTIAGNGESGDAGDGGPAALARFGAIEDLALAPDGGIYVADRGNQRVRRIGVDGVITTVAGTGVAGFNGDGLAASATQLDGPTSLAVAPDGALHIGEYGGGRVRRIGVDGMVTTVAGGGQGLTEGAAVGAAINPLGIALSPGGDLSIASHGHLFTAGRAMPGVGLGEIVVPSEDGGALYQFSAAGRHLKTLDAVTGQPLLRFDYDAVGQLSAITDINGQQTSIERDAQGRPGSILAPYGRRTTLSLDDNGYMDSITNPAGEAIQLETSATGLLSSFADASGSHSFVYDGGGQLIRDNNAVDGFATLTRLQDSYTTVITLGNALGHSDRHELRKLPDGDTLRSTLAPNGALSSALLKLDGTSVLTDANGIVTTIAQAPDPRWGLQAPYVSSMIVRRPDGQIISTMVATRTALLSSAGDPLSLRLLTDTITLNGRSTTTVYDAVARTLTTLTPSGARSTTSFDTSGRPLLAQADGMASARTIYDIQGRPVRVIEWSDAITRTSVLTYNQAGLLESVADALGHVSSYQYDEIGRVLTRTLATGHTYSYRYDDAGNLLSQVDPRGLRLDYEYDDQNRLVATIADPAGRAVRGELFYDAAGNLVRQVEDAGAGRLNITTRYEYQPGGAGERYLLSKLTDPLNHETRMSYTLSGQLKTLVDTMGRTTIYTYTPEGWLEAVSAPGGLTTHTSYNAEGQPLSVSDPRGVTTRYRYNALGQLEQRVDGAASLAGSPAISQTTSYRYDPWGRPVAVVDALGKASTTIYDPFSRVVEQRDPLSNTLTLEYDLLDRLVARTAGANTPGEAIRSTYQYDPIGRLLEQRVDPAGLNLRTQYRYSRAGSADSWSLQEIVDPRGKTTAYIYDSLGQRAQLIDAASQVWRFSHDNLGRLTAQTDPLGRSVTMQIDALGRTTALTEAGQVERWFYQPDGALERYADLAGRETRYHYDPAGRVDAVDYPQGTADVSFRYDLAGNVITMTDGLDATSYQYDALNRLVARTRGGRTVSYAYDQRGLLSDLGYWGQGSVHYDYDDAGRLSALTPWGGPASSYSYLASGQLDQIVRPNGVTSSYGYDGAGRLLSLLHQRGGATPATLEHIQYTLDPNGNRSAVDDADGLTSFTYDELNRLVQVRYPALPGGPAAQTDDFTLDAVGNRLGGAGLSYGYDPGNRVISSTNGLATTSYQYDLNNNLSFDGSASYSYDGANRLVRLVKDGVTRTYGYDGWGTLVRETVETSGVTTTTELLVDELAGLPRVLGELRSDGTQTRYAYGPEGLAAQQTLLGGAPQALLYPLADGQGSLRQLTDPSGLVLLRRSYDAFGNLRQSSGSAATRFGYTGEPHDPASGLIYLRARHYHPALGRFLQRDSFAGLQGRPQSLNRYAYAESNPSTYTDPSGHFIGLDGALSLGDAVMGELLGYEDAAKVRTVAKTAAIKLATLPGDIIKGIYSWGKNFLTDPAGTLRATGEMMITGPFQSLRMALQGAMCGDMEMMTSGSLDLLLELMGGAMGYGIVDSLAPPGLARRSVERLDRQINRPADPDYALAHFPWRNPGPSLSDLSQKELIKALRDTNTAQGRRVAALFEGGRIRLRTIDTVKFAREIFKDPGITNGTRGLYRPQEPDVINLILENLHTLSEAAGTAGHETIHYIQYRRNKNYTKQSEIEAMRYQAAIDATFPLQEEDDWIKRVNRPPYNHLPDK